jgi:HK97 family phage major capsid protein
MSALAVALRSARERLEFAMLNAETRSSTAHAVAEVDTAAADLERYQAAGRTVASVIREARTYRLGGDHSFMADLLAVVEGAAPAAEERIARHRREMADLAVLDPERRDIASTTLNGLVPPDYITESFAAAVRGKRVVADLIRADLGPEGMSVIVPVVTTATTAASQTSQGQTIPTPTDPAITDRTGSVVTIMASAIVSRQAFERARTFDQLIVDELGGVLAQQIETQVLNGSGASGQMLGVLGTSGVQSTTYTSASPTSAELSTKAAALLSSCSVPGLCDAIAMHPRRWLYFSSRTEAGFDQALQPPQPGDPAGTVARLHGVPILTTPSMPTNLGAGTNEDRIIALHRGDFRLFEEPLVVDRIEQYGPGTVRVTVRQYAALVARTPAAAGVMSGTGLLAVPS